MGGTTSQPTNEVRLVLTPDQAIATLEPQKGPGMARIDQLVPINTMKVGDLVQFDLQTLVVLKVVDEEAPEEVPPPTSTQSEELGVLDE